jgi:hypothetical protein
MTEPTQLPESLDHINIRPGVSILSVLRHLNYKPWFALAEFVDNSIQSLIDHGEELRGADGSAYKLRVTIELDEDGRKLVVRDNAAGIYAKDYARAFRPAQVPPDRSGLAEFGMGLKAASCWFAPRWSVRTKALGELVERTVSFDIGRIVFDEIEELAVKSRAANAAAHYTEITLFDVFVPPKTKTITKIREHLGSIYRVFLREGLLELWFHGVPVTFEDPKVLSAPYFKDGIEAQRWYKAVDLDFGMNQRVHGFAALRETGSTAEAGFALFRRRRLIQGSREESYRPSEIFGSSNSFTYQRLFGELELEGFEVSHTKDGFQWDDYEDIVLDALKRELDAAPTPLLSQAEGYRSRVRAADVRSGAELATERTADVLEQEAGPVLQRQLAQLPDVSAPIAELPTAALATRRVLDVRLELAIWRVELELSTDPGLGDWVSISDEPSNPGGNTVRRVGIRLALAHPFMERFGGTTSSEIEPLLRVAIAIVLSEITARESGVKGAGTLRRNINEILRDALAKP